METPPPLPQQQPSSAGNPAWPKAIGIIAIIIGGFGLLSGLWQTIAPLVSSPFQSMGDQPVDPAKEAAFLEKWQIFIIASGVIVTIAAVLLLIGGVNLIKRRRNAGPILRGWAVLKMVASAVVVYFSMPMVDEQLSIMLETHPLAGSVDMQQVEAITRGAVKGGLIFSLLWFFALPVFVLIWFGRRRIRSEMDQWPQNDPGGRLMG